jgi:hypothetical protein
MTLGSTQSLTEMSTRNLPWVKGSGRLRLTISPPPVGRLSRENAGTSTASQPYGPSRSVTGIALPLRFVLNSSVKCSLIKYLVRNEYCNDYHHKLEAGHAMIII